MHNLGLIWETESILAFFGRGEITLEQLQLEFPKYHFCFLNQTHSDIVHEVTAVSPDKPTGDAHFTREKNIALVVQTADCLPLMVKDADNKIVAMIHAGWKGVENGIIKKTIARLQSAGFSQNLVSIIGPHILERSFEVGLDVAEKLVNTVPRLSLSDCCRIHHPDTNKRYIDLALIARTQLADAGASCIWTCAIDTKSSDWLASRRRQGEGMGRNWSFVVKK